MIHNRRRIDVDPYRRDLDLEVANDTITTSAPAEPSQAIQGPDLDDIEAARHVVGEAPQLVPIPTFEWNQVTGEMEMVWSQTKEDLQAVEDQNNRQVAKQGIKGWGDLAKVDGLLDFMRGLVHGPKHVKASTGTVAKVMGSSPGGGGAKSST